MKQFMIWPRRQYDFSDPTALARLFADAAWELCRRYRREYWQWPEASPPLHRALMQLLNDLPSLHENHLFFFEDRESLICNYPGTFGIVASDTKQCVLALELAYDPIDGGLAERIRTLAKTPARERWLIVANDAPNGVLESLEALKGTLDYDLTICYFDRRKIFTIFSTQANTDGVQQPALTKK